MIHQTTFNLIKVIDFFKGVELFQLLFIFIFIFIMNGYLYKSFCYETVDQVAAGVHSSFFLEGFGVIQSVSGFGSSLTVNYLNSSGNLQSFVYPLATCEKLGFDNSFTGLTVDDSIHISSAVVGVLIAAWCIKILRRVL